MRLRRPALLLPRGRTRPSTVRVLAALAATGNTSGRPEVPRNDGVPGSSPGVGSRHGRAAHNVNVTADASGGDSVSISRDLLDVLAKILNGRADPRRLTVQLNRRRQRAAKRTPPIVASDVDPVDVEPGEPVAVPRARTAARRRRARSCRRGDAEHGAQRAAIGTGSRADSVTPVTRPGPGRGRRPPRPGRPSATTRRLGPVDGDDRAADVARVQVHVDDVGSSIAKTSRTPARRVAGPRRRRRAGT